MENNSNRNLWIDYLRSAITVLVVAHHSGLAYTIFANFDTNVYINSTHAIVDSKRWIGLDVFVNFNDIFFMSLMFLIGGLFLSKSIAKKGISSFVMDRIYRLLIPFLFVGTLFMLFAYYPSFLISHSDSSILAYIIDFFTTQNWPVGPPWFIWVLFVFNLLFVLFNPILQKMKPKIILLFSIFKNKPILLFLFLFLITWVFYVPIAYTVGAETWTGFGPFDFQKSRMLLYFGYFIVGCLIGNTDFNSDVFAMDSIVVKKWWIWVLLCLLIFITIRIIVAPLTQMVQENKLNEFTSWMIYFTVYVTSCTMSCLAFLTTFRKFIRVEKRWWNSLSENAYLIYLIHYIFVVWCQFLLLEFDIPAFVKFLITFIFGFALSWIASILLRKNKLIRKYL
jgi:glucans biosynthesis protein C